MSKTKEPTINPIELRLECDCGHPWHQLIFRYYKQTEWTGKDGKTIRDIPDLGIWGKVVHGGLLKRIKVAWKYIICKGYEAEFDIVLMEEKMVEALEKLHKFTGECLKEQKK